MKTEAPHYMDHVQATQLSAVEKYLLGELPPPLRDEFEEHFFDCQECAADLRVTAAFIDAAKKELRAKPAIVPTPVSGMQPRSNPVWPNIAVWAALAACLLLIAYQNLVVLPRSRSELAELRAPEILPALSLVGGNSRGAAVPVVAVAPASPLLLQVDIPTQDRFTSYTCLLYSPAGSVFSQVRVSAQEAKDTVALRFPQIGEAGNYNLAIQGNGDPNHPGSVELARLSFVVKAIS